MARRFTGHFKRSLPLPCQFEKRRLRGVLLSICGRDDREEGDDESEGQHTFPVSDCS
jgi:hypothetical protein